LLKNVFKIILLSCLLLTAQPSVLSATLLESIPLDSWVYDVVEELHTQGFLSSLHKNVKPYGRGQIAALVLEMNLKQKQGGLRLTDSQLWLLGKLNQEFRYELDQLYYREQKSKEGRTCLRYGTSPVAHWILAEGDSSYGRLQARFEASLQFGQRFVLKDRMVIDNRAEKERRYKGREWKNDLTGVFDQAYVNIDMRYFHLLLGREHLRWGPGREDVLLLSDQIPPFDMIKMEGGTSSFKLVYFAAVLDQVWVPEGPFQANRYLSGHRINLRLGLGVEMGVSEVVLYGGEGRNPEPHYLNPLLPYYGEQYNQDTDDNVLWSFDISLSMFRNKEVYFELLVDDFQYDFQSEPHQTGIQLGLSYAEPFGWRRSLANLEYTRINNWVYGQNKSWNRYTFHGWGMGSILGPDADRWSCRLTYHLTKDVDLAWFGEYRREGEGRIDTPQTPAVPSSNGFPSGIVEKTNRHKLIFSYQPSARLKLDLRGEYSKIENVDNKNGREENTFLLSAKLSLSLWKERRF
jgi:hypothetical protein